MISHASRALAATMLALAAAGCGLKGPLYSPDDKKETVGTAPAGEQSSSKRRTPMPPAPQAQKKDAADAANPTPSSDTQSSPSAPESDRPADAEPTPPPDR